MKKMVAFNRLILGALFGIAGIQFGGNVSAQDTEGEFGAEGARVYRREIVVFGQDVTLKKHEISRDIVVIGGNLTIEGTARGDVVVVFGSVRLTGEAERDMVVVFGSADIVGGAEMSGDAVIVGGKLNIEPGATLSGGRREFTFGNTIPDLTWVGDWFVKGVLHARPIPPQYLWVWAVAGALFVTYLLLAAVFPQPIGNCVQALETNPAASFVVGLIGLVVLGPLVFLLVISVAGIFVIPVLFFALVVAAFLGKAAIYQCTGKQVGRAFNLPNLQQPVVALGIGVVLCYLLYTVPVLGFLVWGLTLAWGLGAVMVAIYTRFQREHSPAPTFESTPALLSGSAPASESKTGSDAPPELPDSITLIRAGFWVRFWASLLDAVLLGILLAFTGPFFFVLWASYHVVMWIWKGTTIGGIVAGIKVLRLDGQPMNFSVALVRSLSSFFSAVVLFLGFFWAGWDRDKQSWHDKIAGTIVVRMPKGMSLF